MTIELRYFLFEDELHHKKDLNYISRERIRCSICGIVLIIAQLDFDKDFILIDKDWMWKFCCENILIENIM